MSFFLSWIVAVCCLLTNALTDTQHGVSKPEENKEGIYLGGHPGKKLERKHDKEGMCVGRWPVVWWEPERGDENI